MHYEIAGGPRSATLVALVGGVPAGLRIREESLACDLQRWARAHGCENLPASPVVCSGVSAGTTTGAPVAIALDNAARAEGAPARSVACPGTAELAAAAKYDADDLSSIAERTDVCLDAMRVVAAGVAREFLAEFDVEMLSCTTRIGRAAMREASFASDAPPTPFSIEASPLRCPSPSAARAMEDEIERARLQGDSLGGSFSLCATGVVAGLGGLQGEGGGLFARLAAAVFGVEGVIGVEFGEPGRFERQGSQAIDAVTVDHAAGFSRASNRAGGIEGGVSTGLPLVIQAHVLAPARRARAQESVDAATLESRPYAPERPVCCDVAEKAIVAESAAAFALASAYTEKFGADAMGDIHAAAASYARRLALSAR